MNIIFAEKRHFELVKKLWLDSFEDTKEYVDFFFDNMDFINTDNKILLYIKDGEVASMMFLIKCPLVINKNTTNAYYIFAVATDKKHKKKGYMKALEDYAVSYLKLAQIEYVFLVPQTKELFSLYEKLGYNASLYLGKHTLLNNDVKINKFNIDTITRENFIKKREHYYNNIKKSFRIDDDFILNEAIYEQKIVKAISADGMTGYIIAIKSKNGCAIVESDMTLEQLNYCCSNLCEYFNVEKITYINHQNKNTLYGCYKYIGNTIDMIKNDVYMNLMLL